jgi:hypothetical protein
MVQKLHVERSKSDVIEGKKERSKGDDQVVMEGVML